MFDSYDSKAFGNRIKSLRKQLGYSQANVSKATNINIDTLRKLENGYTIPQFYTLTYLSAFYKTDLHKLFNTYKSSYFLLNFYSNIDILIAKSSAKEIEEQYNIFKKEINEIEDLELVDENDLLQLSLLIKALSCSYSDKTSDWYEALEILYSALRVTNPKFNIQQYDKFMYTYFELRILLVVAACLGNIKDCITSIKVSEYIINALDNSIYSSKGEDLLLIKSISNISYNYHRLSDHNAALLYADKGIQYSIQKGNMEILHFLYLRKGVAEFRLDKKGYLESLSHCLSLLKIKNDLEQYKYYKNTIFRQYNINIS